MKRTITAFLCAMALCILMPLCSGVNAKPAVTEMIDMPELSDWVIDGSGNMLYAISKADKSLLFINTDTMEVEQKIKFFGAPTDILLDGGELYIAIYSKDQICVVDVESKELTRTIKTISDAYQIAKDGKHLYYVEYDQSCDVYEYDLETNKHKKMITGLYWPDMVVNPKEHILYIGESGTTGSNLHYYSTITGKPIVTPRYEQRQTVSLPRRDIRFDGEYVYYSNLRVDGLDAFNIEGDYGSTSYKTLKVHNGLVYKENGIYDRDSHCLLGTYQVQPTLVEASKNAVYMYNAKNKKVERFTDDGKEVTSENVVSLISGKKTEPLLQTLQSDKHLKAYVSLDMKYTLTDMLLEEETNTIYAISEAEKAMFFINATTMNLEKTITFTSSPTTLRLHEDLVYVGLGNARQIVTIHTKNRTIQDKYHVTLFPKVFTVGKNSICYSNGTKAYVIDKKTEADTDLGFFIGSFKDMQMDEENQILYYTKGYIGKTERGYYFNMKTKKSMGNTKTCPNIYRKIFFDGNYVYLGGYVFDKTDPTKVLGCFDEDEDIRLLKNGRIYTESYIYDAKTLEFIDINYYGDTCNLFDAYASGKMLYYTKEDKLLEMIDEANIRTVVFDSDGGNYEDIVIVDRGGFLKEPKVPVREGYEFLGWYDGVKDNVKWDFKKNTVENDLYLIARWEKRIIVPTEVRVENFGESEVRISWIDLGFSREYQVYRATSINGSYSLICTTMYDEYYDTSVEQGRTYYYKVRAVVTEDGVKHYSKWSESKSVTTMLSSSYIYGREIGNKFEINIQWFKIDKADGYEVYRSTSKNGKYSLITTTSKTMLSDKNLHLDTTYYYKVRAYRTVDKKRVYSEYSEVMEVPLHSNMVNYGILKVDQVEKDSIRLDWVDNDGGYVFEVYRATNSNGPFVYQGKTDKSWYTQYNLQAGMTYYYRIRPVLKHNGKTYYGKYSKTVKATTTATKMKKLKGNSLTSGAVGLEFGKVSGMQGYEVYRATSSNGTYTLIGTSKGSSFTDKKAAAGQTYYYKVRGYCNVGKDKAYTTYSNAVKIQAVFTAPAKVKAAKKSKTSIQISWNGVKDAVGYEVYQSTAKNGSYKMIGSTKGKNITSRNLKKGKTYYFKVRAYRQVGSKKVYSKHTNIVTVKL